MNRSGIVAAVAIACAASACREPTQVDVIVRTDTACELLEGTEIGVAPTPAEAGSRPPGASTRDCGAGSIGNVVLVPDDANDAAFSLRVIAGFKKPVESCSNDEDFDGVGPEGEGCIASRRALSFIPHSALVLPIDLREACVGVPCPLDQTCVRGRCVPASIRCEEGEPCDEDVLVGSGGGGQGGSGGQGGGGGQGGAGGATDEVLAITAGAASSCARYASGKLLCWGANDFGQFGTGLAPSPGLIESFAALTGTTAGPAIGGQHGCAADERGIVFCSGSDSSGALGNGPGDASSSTPIPAMVPPATRIEAGGLHSCALAMDGTIHCWGHNLLAQCGAAAPMLAESPLAIAGGPWKAVSTGTVHTCAIDALDEVWCWGSNVTSEGGQPPSSTLPMPTKVQSGGQGVMADDVSAGYGHTCIVRNMTVYCWGKNDVGQLCADPGGLTGTHTPQPCPVGKQVREVGSAANGACALDNDDQVLCWGSAALTPEAVRGDTFAPSMVTDNAKQIAVGDDHACALTHGGQVVCWGKNDEGQVDGTPGGNAVLPPTQVLGPP